MDTDRIIQGLDKIQRINQSIVKIQAVREFCQAMKYPFDFTAVK